MMPVHTLARAHRSPHLAELASALEAGARGLGCDEMLARLAAEDVPRFEQVVASQALVETRHPALGRLREPRPPVRFDVTPAAITRPAPGLGEHGEEVLRELGLEPARIAALREEGVVA
jgi:crotonobetainyl-CoA:carnitine CoA-transferase CaiB-like acyl-CoA transferase